MPLTLQDGNMTLIRSGYIKTKSKAYGIFANQQQKETQNIFFCSLNSL